MATTDDDFPVLTDVVRVARPAASPAVALLVAAAPPTALPAAPQAVPAAPRPNPTPDRLARTMPLEALYGQPAARPFQVAGIAATAAPSVKLEFDTAAPPPAAQQELALRPEEVARASAQLRDEIEGAILRDLNMRIEPLVEARLKEKLADLLEQVLAGMTAELKLTVRDIVREAVDQAVSQEWAARDKRILQAARPIAK